MTIAPIYSKVVGTTFYAVPWDALHKGMPLTLQREPDNEHDENAIAVYAETYGNVGKIGHLNRELAANMALFLDQGNRIDCVITEITGGVGQKTNKGINIMLQPVRVNFAVEVPETLSLGEIDPKAEARRELLETLRQQPNVGIVMENPAGPVTANAVGMPEVRHIYHERIPNGVTVEEGDLLTGNRDLPDRIYWDGRWQVLRGALAVNAGLMVHYRGQIVGVDHTYTRFEDDGRRYHVYVGLAAPYQNHTIVVHGEAAAAPVQPLVLLGLGQAPGTAPQGGPRRLRLWTDTWLREVYEGDHLLQEGVHYVMRDGIWQTELVLPSLRPHDIVVLNGAAHVVVMANINAEGAQANMVVELMPQGGGRRTTVRFRGNIPRFTQNVREQRGNRAEVFIMDEVARFPDREPRPQTTQNVQDAVNAINLGLAQALNQVPGEVTWRGAGTQPPADPVEGAMYMNTETQQLNVFMDGHWRIMMSPPEGVRMVGANLDGDGHLHVTTELQVPAVLDQDIEIRVHDFQPQGVAAAMAPLDDELRLGDLTALGTTEVVEEVPADLALGDDVVTIRPAPEPEVTEDLRLPF